MNQDEIKRITRSEIIDRDWVAFLRAIVDKTFSPKTPSLDAEFWYWYMETKMESSNEQN